MGAPTNDARAEERVAEKIPAVMSGANAEIVLITCKSIIDITFETFHVQGKEKWKKIYTKERTSEKATWKLLTRP